MSLGKEPSNPTERIILDLQEGKIKTETAFWKRIWRALGLLEESHKQKTNKHQGIGIAPGRQKRTKIKRNPNEHDF